VEIYIMSIQTDKVLSLIKPIWLYAPGLYKYVFHWEDLPNPIKVLAAMDPSGFVMYQGTRYYVNYIWKTNTIAVEVA
jgi:hypothetical protein